MSDDDRVRWNERYAGLEPADLGDVALPARFAAYDAEFPTTGHGLELACGSGAAAVWLARRGLDVFAVDVSPVAIARARDLAERAGVADRCRVAVADLDEGLPAGPPAAVVLCHRFRDPRLDQALIARCAPGGLLAVSALSEVGASPGRFRAPPGALLAAFGTLDVIDAGEADGEAWLLARA